MVTDQIRAEALTEPQIEQLRTALFDAFQPKGADGAPSKQSISDSKVSETWGGQITQKALIEGGRLLSLHAYSQLDISEHSQDPVERERAQALLMKKH